MEGFRIAHADGGVTTIRPLNKEEWVSERVGGKTPARPSSLKRGEIISLLSEDELPRFGGFLTRMASPDIASRVAERAARFGVMLMRREYEEARNTAEWLRDLAHHAELADATLKHVTKMQNSIGARHASDGAETAQASDEAEVTGGPLSRRIVDVLRAYTGTIPEESIAAELHVADDRLEAALGECLRRLVEVGILFTRQRAGEQLRYGVVEGWR